MSMRAFMLWAEMTISGFLYITAIGFIVFACYEVDIEDIVNFLDSPRLSQSYIVVSLSALLVGVSNLAGILSHLLIPRLFRPVIALFKKMGLSLFRSPIHSGEPDIIHYQKLIKVLVFGSEALQRELHYQWRLQAILRSLTFALGLLSFSSAIWSVRGLSVTSPLYTFLTIGLLTLTCFAGYLRQRVHFMALQDAAFEIVCELEEKTQAAENRKMHFA